MVHSSGLFGAVGFMQLGSSDSKVRTGTGWLRMCNDNLLVVHSSSLFEEVGVMQLGSDDWKVRTVREDAEQ